MTATTDAVATDDLTAEVTAWLEEQLGPRPHRRGVVGPARPVGLGRAHVAGRVVRQGPLARRGRPGHADHRHVRRPGRARRARPAARRPDHRRPRHRRAEAALPARHRHRPEGLVPAVQRAGRRIRPRRAQHPRRARRRRVGRQRPEGVDLGRPLVRSRHAARPHRPRRRPSTRASRYFALDMHQAGRRDPPAARDDRAGDVQRGLPHRRARPERRRPSAASTTAGRSPTRR